MVERGYQCTTAAQTIALGNAAIERQALIQVRLKGFPIQAKRSFLEVFQKAAEVLVGGPVEWVRKPSDLELTRVFRIGNGKSFGPLDDSILSKK